MTFSFSVPMPDGSTYRVSRLLAKGLSNVKLSKSDKAGTEYKTFGLSLAPAKISGFNLCPAASAACKAGCLFTSGYARIHPRMIQPARIAKARMLRLSPLEFKTRLVKELDDIVRTARRKGYVVAVRLNVLSDVQWEKECPDLFSRFSNVQFYDYTKIAPRMQRFCEGNFPSNYHLTFSWSGTNKDKCVNVLRAGGNVAVPFHVKYRGENRQPLPDKFLDYPIFDGDVTDLRFLDPKGHIVGLRAKGDAKRDKESGFVITPSNTLEEV